ncbi:DUF2478 domain-containing protein [Frigidibacter sp. RF13]|uniref:DUF2478 domain-containing protein n=1 Tax=Frigidibacter sp. RF13 TaxID=2997340 RepID=UPI00226E183D|nr:DUF2478 domain-containing protein [Frigidibacter sp. RF13]MCY1127181.1 DUF2478 domain-containing protein [Frigidibacter sp. RF13]
MSLAYVTLPGRGETDAFLRAAADHLAGRGLKVAGTVQTNSERACTHHCDMDVRVLPDGPVIRINQDLGPGSTGCRLDPGALEAAVAEVAPRLAGADILILNKFGKHEAEGRGFRTLIGEAIAEGIPVVIGVNALNLPAFLAFAEGCADPLSGDLAALDRWLSGLEALAAE